MALESARNIVIMAGGTGGHVFPALAIAEALKAKGHQVTWLGTSSGIESRLVVNAGFVIDTIPIDKLRGKGVFTWLMLPSRLLKAIYYARQILLKRKADLVLGMGGFVTGPGGIASKLLRIPLVVHEQNAIAGMTNRYLAKIARLVLCAFPGAFSHKVQTVVTGNPIRASIIELLHEPYVLSHDRPLRLLVIGGSLGAKILNEIVPAAIGLMPQEQRPLVTHQAGERTVAIAKAEYAAQQVSANIVTFIDDMAKAYKNADIVICRAGALTIAELAAAKRPAILVPYLQAVDNHQYYNAMYLTESGAAVCIEQKDLTAEKLADTLSALNQSRENLVAMSERAAMLAKPHATDKVLGACLGLLQ